MRVWMYAAVLTVGLAAVPGTVLGQNGLVAAERSPAARESQGYLGVDIRDLSEDQLGALKLREVRGAEIVRVDHDGPAGKVGLREHDVILQMNGQVVEGQEQLRRMLRETPAGRTVVLVISRDGQQQVLSAKMANREEVERLAWQQHMTVPAPDGMGPPPAAATPDSAPRSGAASVPRAGLGFLKGGAVSVDEHAHGLLGTMRGGSYTGVTLEPIGPQLADFFGVQSGRGLLVRSVEANSPAALAGLRAGDVVLQANQAAMGGVSDWARSVHESKGKPMPITVLRDKKEQTLTITPESKRRSALQWPQIGPPLAAADEPEPVTVAQGATLLR